jgi:hypothetical protein
MSKNTTSYQIMGLDKMKNTDAQDLTDLRFKPKEKSVHPANPVLTPTQRPKQASST